jgi:hypothetical protein
MTPRFYGFLWMVFAVTALILWVGGVFTMLTLVAYGFVAFGLVFTGMICVLPGLASHPPVAVRKPVNLSTHKVPAAVRLRFH